MPIRVTFIELSEKPHFAVRFDEGQEHVTRFWLDERGLHVKEYSHHEKIISFEDLKSQSDGQLTFNLV